MRDPLLAMSGCRAFGNSALSLVCTKFVEPNEKAKSLSCSALIAPYRQEITCFLFRTAVKYKHSFAVRLSVLENQPYSAEQREQGPAGAGAVCSAMHISIKMKKG